MTAWNEFVCVPQAIISSRERVAFQLYKQRLMGWNRFYCIRRIQPMLLDDSKTYMGVLKKKKSYNFD